MSTGPSYIDARPARTIEQTTRTLGTWRRAQSSLPWNRSAPASFACLPTTGGAMTAHGAFAPAPARCRSIRCCDLIVTWSLVVFLGVPVVHAQQAQHGHEGWIDAELLSLGIETGRLRADVIVSWN